MFEIASFLIYSAKGCFREPKAYGPLRLLQTFSLVTEIPKHINGIPKDEFLSKIKKEIDENILKDMDDREFEQFISKLSLEVAREIKKRKLKRARSLTTLSKNPVLCEAPERTLFFEAATFLLFSGCNIG